MIWVIKYVKSSVLELKDDVSLQFGGFYNQTLIDGPSIQWYLYRKYQIYSSYCMKQSSNLCRLLSVHVMVFFENTKIAKMHLVHNCNEMKVHLIIPRIPFRNNSTCDCSEFLAVSVLTSVYEMIGQQQNSSRHHTSRLHDQNNHIFCNYEI